MIQESPSIPPAPTIPVNPYVNRDGEVDNFQVATGGLEGASTRVFIAEADAQLPYRPLPNQATELLPVPAQPLLFAIAWPGSLAAS